MAGHSLGSSPPSSAIIFVAALLAPVLLITSVLAGVMLGLFGSDDNCGDSGGVVAAVSPTRVGGLTPAQLANASAVIAEGVRMHVPAKGIVVALATASRESHFTNYANDGRGGDLLAVQRGIAASLGLPHEAVGTDHGSLGIFQQQWPWWGSMQELMTPAVAARKFYAALLRLPGWQEEPVTVAAQWVQASAYPDAYADDEPLARQLLGLPKADGATLGEDAAATPADGDLGCTPGEGVSGRVVFPLPAGSGYRDNHNYGRVGAHWASVHTGDDLSVACGTPVLATTAGTVQVRTDQPWAGRWLVQISTGTRSLTTWYAHMRALTVNRGQHVRAGEQIGEVGDLGNATGCHLHFEVHPRGGSIYQDSVDPIAWLHSHLGRNGSGAVRSAAWASSGVAFTVATFNTLGTSHTVAGRSQHPGMASGPVRTRGVVRILERYRVDVVGLQEFQQPQANAFAALAGSRYSTWHPGRDTQNSIAWRRDRWRLVAASSVAIPYFNGHILRMPVVRLRDRTTGNDVTFLNVHNPADTRRFPHQARWRTVAVTREVALVRQLSAGGSPVIMTGDLNDRRSAFCRLNTSAGLASSNGGTGSPCRPAAGSRIDWILGSESIQFSDDIVDRGALARATTDHPVVIARARVNHEVLRPATRRALRRSASSRCLASIGGINRTSGCFTA